MAPAQHEVSVDRAIHVRNDTIDITLASGGEGGVVQLQLVIFAFCYLDQENGPVRIMNAKIK